MYTVLATRYSRGCPGAARLACGLAIEQRHAERRSTLENCVSKGRVSKNNLALKMTRAGDLETGHLDQRQDQDAKRPGLVDSGPGMVHEIDDEELNDQHREGIEELTRKLQLMSSGQGGRRRGTTGNNTGNAATSTSDNSLESRGSLEDGETHVELQKLELMYSNEMMLVKGLVCWTLLVFVWWGIWVMQNDDETAQDQNQPTSAILAVYQRVGYALSVALLLPSLFEMGFTWLILVGDRQEPTMTLIKKISSYNLLEYSIRGTVLALAAVLFSLPLLLVLTVMGLPRHLCRRRFENNLTSDRMREEEEWWSAFYRLFGLLPDALLTWSLFPLSFFIIVDDSGSSAMSVITDLVAVQIFATLDDMIVQMLLLPHEGLHSLFRLYASRLKRNPIRRPRLRTRTTTSSNTLHEHGSSKADPSTSSFSAT